MSPSGRLEPGEAATPLLLSDAGSDLSDAPPRTVLTQVPDEDASSTSTSEESFPQHWLLPLVLIYACHRCVNLSARAHLSEQICDIYEAYESTFSDCYKVRWLQTDIQPRLAPRITETVVGAVSTLWWSRISDISGRTPVLLLVLLGALVSDVGLAATAFATGRTTSQSLTLFFIALENALGGYMTFAAITQTFAVESAYLTTRLRLFGLMAGLYYLAPVVSIPIDSVANGIVALSGLHHGTVRIITSFSVCIGLVRAAMAVVSSKAQDPASLRDSSGSVASMLRMIRRCALWRNAFRMTMPDSKRWIILGLATFLFGSTVDILHISYSDYTFSDLGALAFAVYGAIHTGLAVLTWMGMIPMLIWSFKRRNFLLSHDSITVARFVKTLAIAFTALGLATCIVTLSLLAVPQDDMDMIALVEATFYILAMFVMAFTVGAVPAIFYLASISIDEVHNLGCGMGFITVVYSVGRQVGYIGFNVALMETQDPKSSGYSVLIVWFCAFAAVLCLPIPPERPLDEDWPTSVSRFQSRESLIDEALEPS